MAVACSRPKAPLRTRGLLWLVTSISSAILPIYGTDVCIDSVDPVRTRARIFVEMSSPQATLGSSSASLAKVCTRICAGEQVSRVNSTRMAELKRADTANGRAARRTAGLWLSEGLGPLQCSPTLQTRRCCPSQRRRCHRGTCECPCA